MEASLTWCEGMSFTTNNRHHVTHLDASADFEGQDSAPTPKEVLLNAMMGCTAMDVVSILKKMRVEIKKFTMTIEAEKNLDPPVHFVKTHLVYYLDGDIAKDKAVKAIESSLTKYCGVNYMISKVCDITYDLVLNGATAHTGMAAFVEPHR